MIWERLSRILNKIDEMLFGPRPNLMSREQLIDRLARRIVEKERSRPKVKEYIQKMIAADNKAVLKNELEEYRKAREGCYFEILTLALIGGLKELDLKENPEETKEENEPEDQHKHRPG
jgi:hypothetical protein